MRDDFTSLDPLPNLHSNRTVMRISSGISETVFDNDQIAASCAPSGKADYAVSCRLDRRAGRDRNIDSSVELRTSAHRRFPFAERRGYGTETGHPLGVETKISLCPFRYSWIEATDFALFRSCSFNSSISIEPASA